MPTTARPYVTAGVALVGASVISASAVVAPGPESRQMRLDVDLVAAVESCAKAESTPLCSGVPGAQSATPFTPAADSTNMFNIPANLFIALANTPFNLFTALGDGNVQLGSEPDGGASFQPTYEGITLAQPAGNVVGLGADLKYGGSWWVYSPTNSLGTDTADVPRYQALTNVLVPFPALSVPLGNILAAVAASQLPMNSGCTGTGPGACDDPNAILSKMFDLRHINALFSPQGYTFPTVKEGVSCSEDGQCYVKDPDGNELPWSGQNVKLDPSTPFTSSYDSLTETPDFSSIRPVTPEFATASVTSLGNGLNTAYNPFVLGTQCGICAPLVPNPDDEPVPGPVFEDPDTTATAEPLAASEQVELSESDDLTETLSESAVTAAGDDDDPQPDTKGPKHRKPSAASITMRQVQDKITTGISRLSDSFMNPGSKSSESADSSSSSNDAASDSNTVSAKDDSESGSGSDN